MGIEGFFFVIVSLAAAAITEVIEQGHAIGFGPDADLAGFREGVVLSVKQVLAVEDDLEAAA